MALLGLPPRGERERVKGEELEAAGICRKCRRPAPNRTRCDECLEKARLVRERRERQGEKTGRGPHARLCPGRGRGNATLRLPPLRWPFAP